MFSAICDRLVRVAGKGFSGGRLTADRLQPTPREKTKDNAETLGTQRLRKEDGDAGRGWKPMFTVYVTATLDNLSSYFLYSNDSNGRNLRRKSLRGMGMHGNLVRENGVCVDPGKLRRFRGERSQDLHA
jgi:hypothetical protein